MVQRVLLTPTALVCAISLPWQALACPVCGFGQDGTRNAFLGTAILMTLVPLVFVGTVLFLIRRHLKKGSAINKPVTDE